MIILVVILLVLRACHTVHAQVPTAAPSMSPTYSSLQVLFPGRQRVQNLTLAQTTDDVRQIFVTTVLQSLICCETYTIVITSVELESPAARRRVLSLTDGRKRRKRREIDGQILMQEQEHDEEGKNETEEDPDFSTLSSLSALSLFNTAPPVVIFNYTVGFLYTEFNFTDMEAAYTTISSELRFTIIGGGFQRSFTEVRDTAPCYTNPTESADGGCAYLRYSTTTSGSVGDTLIPFPTRFPTSSPTIASTPLDVQGVPFAIVMAIVMILCITAFCYFNYFHKGGSLKWLQRRCIECIWNDEDDDDDFTTDVEDDIEMQNKLKSFDDFGDPDIRFGKGHARERRASMKNVPLKPDFTAAPPEIMKSRQQTIKRYSIVGRDLESEALQKHLEKEKSKDTGSSTNSMEMDSLLGNSSVGAMQKMDLSVLGTLWMTVDEPEPELSTSSSSGGGSFTPFEGVGNPPASIKEEDEEAEQEDGYDPANVPAYIGVTAAMGLRVTNPLHNNTPPRPPPPPPPPPAAVKRTEAGKNGGANSPMHASANSNVSEVVDTKGPTAPFHPHFAPLRIPHSESDAASIAAKAPVLFNIPATTPALEASPVRVPVSPVAIADVGANENATANDSDSSSTGTDTSDSEADAVAEAEIEEKKLKAYEQAQIEKEIQSRNATFDKIQGNTRVPASTSALTASVVRGTGTNVEVEVEVEEVKAEMFSDSDSDPEVDIEIDYGTARVDNNADAAYTNTNIRDLEIEMDTEAIEAAIAATVGTVATFIDDGNGNDIIASSDNSTETRVTMPSPPPRRESAISIDAIVAVAAAAALAAASTSSPIAGKDTPVTVSTLTPIHVPVPVEVPVPKSKATDAVPKQSPSPLPAPSLIRVDKVPASEPVPVSVPVVMPKSTTPNPANSVSSAATDIKEVFNPVTIPIPVQAPAVASMSANASIWAAPKSPLKSALPARRASAFMAKKFLSSAASASGTGGSFSASANASHRESVPVPVSVPFSASASVAAPDASSASPSSSGKGQLSAFGAAAANRRRSSMRIVAPPPPESQD